MRFVILFVVCSISSFGQTLAWKFKTSGKVYGSVALHQGLAFVGSEDGSLYALNEVTGELRWKFATRGAVYSTPLIGQEKVFFSSHDGAVYALDMGTGVMQWKFETGGEKFYDMWDYYLSSPTLFRKSILVGSGDGYLYSLDAESGSLNWKFKTGDVIHATPVVEKNTVFIGSFDGNLYALDATTGNLKWKFDTKGEQYFPKGEVPREVLVHKGVVYFGSRDYRVYALNLKSGALLWDVKEEGSWVVAPVSVDDDVLYFGTSDTHAFYGVDRRNGKIRWKTKLPMRIYGKALIKGDLVYAGCFDGTLVAMDKYNGKVSWKFQTDGSKSNYNSVYAEDGSFVPGFELYGSDSAGSEAKILALGSILSSPVISVKTLYFGSSDGYVYAITIN